TTKQTTWTNLEGPTANATAPHPDSRNMVFDRNGDILEADDGGLFRLTTPGAAGTRRWAALNGNLAAVEFNTIAYDNVNHVAFGGAQDNGAPQQNAANGPTWTDRTSGDGGVAQADNVSLPGKSIHYVTFQKLGGLQRQIFTPG